MGTLVSSGLTLLIDAGDVCTWYPQLRKEGRPQLSERMQEIKRARQDTRGEEKSTQQVSHKGNFHAAKSTVTHPVRSGMTLTDVTVAQP